MVDGSRSPEVFDRASTSLWAERTLLEKMQFKLDVERRLLTSGGSRWLPHISRELEAIATRLPRAERARSEAVTRACAALRPAPRPSLPALADAAPPPWGAIFRQHLDETRAMVAEIRALVETNRLLLALGPAAPFEVDGLDTGARRAGCRCEGSSRGQAARGQSPPEREGRFLSDGEAGEPVEGRSRTDTVGCGATVLSDQLELLGFGEAGRVLDELVRPALAHVAGEPDL